MTEEIKEEIKVISNESPEDDKGSGAVINEDKGDSEIVEKGDAQVVELVKGGGNEGTKDEVKKEKVKLSKFSDIFITEKDTFDVVVKYYKDEDTLMVSEVDDAFDSDKECFEFSATFKYPDQGDATTISAQASSFSGRINGSLDNLDIREFMGLEFGRLVTLIRKWDVDKDLNNQNIMNLHPKIVKSLIAQVRSKIGMDGII